MSFENARPLMDDDDATEPLRAEWEHEVGEHNCTLTFEQWKAQRSERLSDWQYAALNDDTRLGFADWCEHNPP